MSELDPSIRLDDEESRPGVARSLAHSAGLAGIATLTSRVLGLVRDQVLASMFGAGNAIDAFNVAFRVPNLVRDLFAEGAMSAAFVPTFTRQADDARQARPRGGSATTSSTRCSSSPALVVMLGIVFARPLVDVFAGDFASVPGKLELTIAADADHAAVSLLVAVAAAFMGMLNSLHRFFVPALSPAMFNVVFIVCALVLVPVMPAIGRRADPAIAIGVLVGGLGQIAIAVAGRCGARATGTRAVLDLRDPGLRRRARADGTGDARAGRDAGQRVRQHGARDAAKAPARCRG